MRFVRMPVKELVDLRVVISLAIVLTIYGFIVTLGGPGDEFEKHLMINVTAGLALWVFGVLLIAYRRWRNMAIPDHELEDIISGINPDAFIVINPDRKITMCSPSVEIMFGYPATEVLEHATDILYFDRRPPESSSEHRIHDQLQRVGFHVGYAKGKHKSGRIIPLEIITGTVRGRRGAVLLLRDITKRVEAEEAHRQKAELVLQLEQNMGRLKETEMARDNLLHMIVHDMRNPLQVVFSALQLIKEETMGAAQSTLDNYVDEALDQTRRLSEMVNSLLDVALLESGTMQLRLGSCDLRVAAKRAMSSFTLLAAEHPLEVSLPSEPVLVVCDSEIIHRVLQNLISNAMNHTPAGTKIQLLVFAGRTEARVVVSDNGPGIPPEYRHKVFDKFVSVQGRIENRPHRSTGIGLTFCKLAVEAHGGHIDVDSELGRGSSFWFTLPWKPSDALVQRTASSGSASAG